MSRRGHLHTTSFVPMSVGPPRLTPRRRRDQLAVIRPSQAFANSRLRRDHSLSERTKLMRNWRREWSWVRTVLCFYPAFSGVRSKEIVRPDFSKAFSRALAIHSIHEGVRALPDGFALLSDACGSRTSMARLGNSRLAFHFAARRTGSGDISPDPYRNRYRIAAQLTPSFCRVTPSSKPVACRPFFA